MTPTEALQMAKDNGARQVDIRFADIPACSTTSLIRSAN